MTSTVLVDTNILIEMLRYQDSDLEEIVVGFGETNINTIIYCEVVRGEPNKTEYRKAEKFLKQFNLIHLDPAICSLAIELMRDYKLSSGLDFADALIAATCLVHKFKLFTKNRKHFDFIPNLTVF